MIYTCCHLSSVDGKINLKKASVNIRNKLHFKLSHMYTKSICTWEISLNKKNIIFKK